MKTVGSFNRHTDFTKKKVKSEKERLPAGESVGYEKRGRKGYRPTTRLHKLKMVKRLKFRCWMKWMIVYGLFVLSHSGSECGLGEVRCGVCEFHDA